METTKSPCSSWRLAPLLLGLGLVLISGPIGSWCDFLNRRLWIDLTYLSVSPWALDRAPGWLSLVVGWGCIARGLGGTRPPPSHLRARFARALFRLRWLPAPVVATLGTYVALARHHVAPLVLTVDVANTPPGSALHSWAIARNITPHENRYGATFDYLFGVTLPPGRVGSGYSHLSHSEFRFAAGQFGIEKWQPDLERVIVGIDDETQHKAALVELEMSPSYPYVHQEGTIRVTRDLLKDCATPTHRGACLQQVTYQTLDDHEVRVVFDCSDIQLAPYEEPPLYD
jgi:hypothetical protein